MLERKIDSITISIPATSANLGPGFDSLGLALDLWNRAEFNLTGQSTRVEIDGYGTDTLPQDEQNLIVQAARALYKRVNTPFPAGIHIRCQNAFPPGSGLGSSSSAILLGLLAANAFLDQPFTRSEIITIATEIEGHPDNVAPALLGGLTISTVKNRQVIARKVSIEPVLLAVVVPRFELPTLEARAALPKQVPLSDAVINLGHTALVVEAFRTGDLDLLSAVMDDRLHQPYRLPLIPGAAEAFIAARGAGAGAVALSGAGPGVIAFANNEIIAQQTMSAMKVAFHAAGLESWDWVGKASEKGAMVEPG